MSERSGAVTPTSRLTRLSFPNAIGAVKCVEGAIRSAEAVEAAEIGVVLAAEVAAAGGAGVAGAGSLQIVGSAAYAQTLTSCEEVAPGSVAEIDEYPGPVPMKLTVPSAPATACRLPYDTSAPAPAAF